MYTSIALKKPKGTSYGFIDEKSEGWQYGEDINRWINEMFIRHSYQHFIFYNDDEPDDDRGVNLHSKGAHAKGILGWNEKRIGWCIHSVPNYPECSDTFKNSKIFDPIDKSQLIYGQSFIYIEVDFTLQTLLNIFLQLEMMDVHIYHETISMKNFLKKNKDVEEKKEYQEYKEYLRVFHFSDTIQHVSKHTKWNKDLYEHFLTIHFQSNVLCETWMKPAIPTSQKVKNVRTIKWENDQEEYYTTNDHSKYAVSMDSENPWIYIGDINRMESQIRRGGGGLLIKNKKYWKLINQILVDYTEQIENPNKIYKPTLFERMCGMCGMHGIAE